MRLKINSFYIYFSFPALAVVSLIVISNFYTDYLLCLCAVIIHELGHLSAMFILGLKPESISIELFNIKINDNLRYKNSLLIDLIVTVAGPLLNLLFFLIFLNISGKFSGVNLFIGLFNLLPAASLDGGQILFLILSNYLRRELSAKIVDIITIIIALPVFFFGILVLLYSKYNFSLLVIGIYLILSLFYREEKYV